MTLDEIKNTRLFRLKQRTLPWYFEIAYLPGITNHAADATSRHPSHATDSEQSDVSKKPTLRPLGEYLTIPPYYYGQ